jgi:PAS domain S-box-containing protein/excisionase family DNA binding protein
MSINTEDTSLNRMLTVDEVAYTLHVHPATVRKWVKSGQLKSYRLGSKGSVRFKTEDVSSFSDSAQNIPVVVNSTIPEKLGYLSHFPPIDTTDPKPQEVIKKEPASSDNPSNVSIKETLQESGEEFYKIFSHSPVAFSLTRLRDNVVIEINERYTHFSGFTRDEIIGRNVSDVNIWVNPEDRDRVMKILKEKGCVVNEECSLRGKSGEIHSVLFSAENINIGGEDCVLVMTLDISKRKKTEEALRDSEEKFSKAFNASANAICIVSMEDDTFLEVNEGFRLFSGYSREEVIGRTAEDLNLLVNQDDQKLVKTSIEKNGKYTNFEILSHMKSGEIRIGLSSAEVMNIRGKPCRIVVITDITERKKAEQASKNSEEKFSKVFSTSAIAIGITSLKTNLYIESNASFSRFTGYPREEIIGRSAADLNLWVKQDELNQWMNKIKLDGRVSNMEFSSRMKSGEIRIGLASAEVITIGDEPCRIIMITDITERKKAEESLSFSDAAFKSIHEAVLALDNDHHITYWNSICEELFSVKAAEAIGKSLFNVIQPVELYPGQNDELQNKLKTQGFNRGERLYNTCESKIWVDMTVRVIEKDGKPCGYVMTASDISERKRMEQELSAYRSQLEELVEKRTKELSTVNKKLEDELAERKLISKELIQARDTAESANRSKSDFLARMSHEIRTPIHGVIGTINLLLDTELKEEQRQYGSMARASADSLLGIINDIRPANYC